MRLFRGILNILALLVLVTLTGCGGGGGTGAPVSTPSTSISTSSSSANAKTIDFQPDGNGFAQLFTNDAQYEDMWFWQQYPETRESQMTTVTAIAEKRSGDQYYGYGVMFCYQNDDNFYELLINSVGSYGVFANVAGNAKTIIPWTNRTAPLNKGLANAITVTQTSPHNFSVSFNGIYETNFTDNTFTGGESGFIMAVPAKGRNFPAVAEDIRFKLTTSPAEYPPRKAPAGTVSLAYTPLDAKFSKSLGKAVIVSTGPNTMHIVDPKSAEDVSVALPANVKAVNLSPDGTLAAALQDGVVSLVDLKLCQLLNSLQTGASSSAAFVNNSGLVYLAGPSDTPGFTVLDGKRGVVLQTLDTVGWTRMAVNTSGIFSDMENRIFTLSGTGIDVNDINSATGSIKGHVGAISWQGTYSASYSVWLSGDQSLLFTQNGAYYRTTDFSQAGSLDVGFVLSMSHSASAQEAVVLGVDHYYGYDHSLYFATPVLMRFAGAPLSRADDIPLPAVGGQQTYGMYIFHTADDGHVAVVRTGSPVPSQSGGNYYLLWL